jgi:hypothetical protein
MKEDSETLDRGTDAYPVPARDDTVTSDQCGVSPPSPSALCGHPHCCAAIASTAMLSPSLWEPWTTRQHHPRHCAPSGLPSATPSSRRTDDDSSGRRPHSHPRSRFWASTGLAMTYAGSKIRQDDQQLHETVHHTAIRSLGLCGTIVNRLPLAHKRRSRSPGRKRRTDSGTLAFFRRHHDIGTSPQSNLRDLEDPPPLPPRL